MDETSKQRARTFVARMLRGIGTVLRWLLRPLGWLLSGWWTFFRRRGWFGRTIWATATVRDSRLGIKSIGQASRTRFVFMVVVTSRSTPAAAANFPVVHRGEAGRSSR